MDSYGSSPLSLTQSWSQCRVEKFLSGNASHSHSRKPGMCVRSFGTEGKSWNMVEVLKKLVKFLPQKDTCFESQCFFRACLEALEQVRQMKR